MLKMIVRALGLSLVVGGVVDATTAASRWSQGAGAAQQKYVDGVQQTTKDPTALAAAASQKMLNGVTAAVTSGYWARRLADVGASGWKAAVTAKAANYGVGVNAAQSKYQKGYQDFWNYATPLLGSIQSMPKATLADSIARATAWIQGAAQYQKP